jgi:hypothetical protein
MEIFKNSRGHFFGILIPGLFLTINVYFFYPELLEDFGFKSNIDLISNDSLGIILFFVFSYVFGIGLRLMKPSWLERLAIVPQFPVILIQYSFHRLVRIFRKDSISIKSISSSVYEIWQEFPYKEWFFTSYIKSSSKTYREFYESILKNEFDNDYKLIDKHFVNYCKTFIYENSVGLSEEVMYNEGLTRFISGILYSIIVSIVAILALSGSFRYVLIYYSLIFVFFLLQLRRIRTKEVLSIFDGYMFLMTKQ